MIRNIVTVILLVLLTIYNLLLAQEPRPRVGLVLSGGGARGFAHVGALKLLDSLKIPVDYIAGTSIGGIAGALYAMGYSGREIEQIARTSDWNELFSDQTPRTAVPYLQKKDDGLYQLELGLKGITPMIPSGLIQGQKVSLLLSSLTTATEGLTDFDQLPISYQCVAVDLISGKEVVLKKGSLAKAMRATMSIPTIFSPVDWGDSLLIDGGLLNNFPADVVKEMGAEVIIGVNVGTPLSKKEELRSLLSILNQTLIITDYVRQQENMNLCDIIITPDLKNYTTTDFDTEEIEEIIQKGQQAASAAKIQLDFLQKKYHLFKTETSLEDTIKIFAPLIQSINISTSANNPAEYYYDLLNCYPDSILDLDLLEERLDLLRKSGKFKKIDVKVKPVAEERVRVFIEVDEMGQPIIFGISIVGNRTLPFNFIYRLLGIKPNDRFDKQLLNQRIGEIYGLGYFEKIDYEVRPVRENYIRLDIHVIEKPLRKLRIGFHYDDYYKIVGRIGLQATNVPLPGIRAEAALEFAGRLNFDYSLAYPSRGLDLPIYPYVRVNYKKIPYNIYDGDSGDKIAEYDDKSFTIGAGLGSSIGNSIVLQIEYHHEYIDIDPNIAGLDPNYFPSWNDELRKINGKIMFDFLDDIILPRKGLHFNANLEASLKRMGSDLEYQQLLLNIDLYHTLFQKHTLHFGGFYTNFYNDLPIYKYPFKGGPASFIGMNYNQIEGNKYGYGRFDYRYEYKKDIFLSLIANLGFYNLAEIFEINEKRTLYGFGIGIKFLSIIGPFELIISRGSKSINQWDRFQTQFYFTAGYSF